jgi:hypothetical protein
MVALAKQIAASHEWKVAADGHDAVAIVFDKLSGEAPKTDAQMIQNYVDVGRRLVDYARRTGLFTVPDDYKLDVTVTPPGSSRSRTTTSSTSLSRRRRCVRGSTARLTTRRRRSNRRAWGGSMSRLPAMTSRR